MQADITVLNGLPVTIEFTILAAEPDVGCMSDYLDEWFIVAINGKPCKSADWIYKRIEATSGEEDRIIKALFEAAEQEAEAYDDYYYYDSSM